MISNARAEQLSHWWDITRDPLSEFARQQLAARFIQPARTSQTHALGRKVCQQVQRRLEAMGHRVALTTHKKSFDLWVDDLVKIEIKAANWTGQQYRDRAGGRFQAHLGKDQVKDSDLIIFGCRNGTWHYFVIPAAAITGPTIEITSYHVEAYSGKYAPYLEAWTQIRQALKQARRRTRQLPLLEVPQ